MQSVSLQSVLLQSWWVVLALTAIISTGVASAQQNAIKKTPLDELNAADIPPSERFPWQPKGLVAVMGSHAWHYWPIGQSAVMHLTTDGKRVTQHAWNSIPGWLGDTVRVSDAASGKELAVFKLPKDQPAKGAGISPSGRFVALCQENPFDWGATVWDVSSKKVQSRFTAKGSSPTQVYFSPKGNLVGYALGGVQFHEVPSGKYLFGNPARSHSGPPVFHPAGNRVYYRMVHHEETTGYHRTFLYELDLSTRKELTLSERPKSFVYGIWTDPLIGMAVSQDGRWLASALETETEKAEVFVSLWNVLEKKPGAKIVCPASVTGVAFSPDNKTLAIALLNGRLNLHERGTGKLLRSLETGSISKLAFSPDGKFLAGANAGNAQLMLWDLTTDQPLHKVADFTKILAVSPDSRKLLIAKKNGAESVASLLDLTNKQVLPLSSSEGQISVEKAAFSPDGQRLALIVSRGASTVLRVVATETGKDIDPKQSFQMSNEGAAKFVFFHPDGKQVMTAGGTTSYLWDLTTWKSQSVKHPWVYLDAAQSHDGKTLVADTTENIKVISLTSLEVMTSYDREEGGCVAVSRDGTKIAHAGQYGAAAQVLNTKNGEMIYEFKGHIQPITALCFDRKSEDLFTAGHDGRILRWFGVTSKQEWRLPGPVTSMQLSPDGRHLLVNNVNGTAYVLRLEELE